MKNQFKEEVEKYLALPPEERDKEVGAILLLRIGSSKNLVSLLLKKDNPQYVDKMIYLLRKYVGQIVSEVPQANEPPAEKSPKTAGKREDHDQLPPEIKRLYTEIPKIRNKARSLHEKLKLCKTEKQRSLIMKELSRMDAAEAESWEKYDHFDPNAPLIPSTGKSITKQVSAARKAITDYKKKAKEAIEKSELPRAEEMFEKIAEKIAFITEAGEKVGEKLETEIETLKSAVNAAKES